LLIIHAGNGVPGSFYIMIYSFFSPHTVSKANQARKFLYACILFWKKI
jgi:hypothetical protein